MGLWRRQRAEDHHRLPPAGIIDHGCASAVGTRRDNQDRWAASGLWAVVSDGVGGHAGGAVAAELTVKAVLSRLGSGGGRPHQHLLDEAVGEANAAVRAGRRADKAVAQMAATVTIALATTISPDASSWLVAHVGDSPAWVVAGAGCAQVTEDHTLVAELVRAGALSPDAAATHPGRNVVTRAIGADERTSADTTSVVLGPGEAIVIASDGLGEALDEVAIHHLVATAPTAQAAAQQLVDTAIERGATDNVTAVVLRHLASSADGSSLV